MPVPFLFKEAKLPVGFPPPGPVGVVLIKHYPLVRMAMVKAAELGQPESGRANRMFMPLFNHIKSHHIAMTAPVDMGYSPLAADEAAPRPESMAFLYASPQTGSPGHSGVVDVVDQKAMTVVSVALRGAYNARHLKKGLHEIDHWLASHPGLYKVVGPPRYLGYNSPFVPPWFRFGEVQLPVESLADKQTGDQ